MVSVGLCSLKNPYLNRSVKENKTINNVISWISNSINNGSGSDFSHADGDNAPLKNYDSYRFGARDSVSMTSKYDYNVALSNTTDEATFAATAIDAHQPKVMLSDAVSNIPAEVLAGMTATEVQALSDITSAMSVAEVVSKMRDNKSFRQEVLNAGGPAIGKDLYVLADSHKKAIADLK